MFRKLPIAGFPRAHSSGLEAAVIAVPGLTQCCFFQQCSDILSTVGYDSIIQHLNNGRKNCKEFEDFLKERYMLFFSEDSGEDKMLPHEQRTI